jgi:hypothetical protein
MKDKRVQIRTLLVSLGVSFVTSLWSAYYVTFVSGTPAFTIKWWYQVLIAPVIFFLLLYWFLTAPLVPHISAYWSQFVNGKLHGFWRGKDLDTQIINHYKKSYEIRIKVTRAYNLFISPKNKNFYKCVSDPAMLKQERVIKLLMHPPCLVSKHIQKRADANRMSPAAFLKTWFDVLEALLVQINSNRHLGLTSEVRFYSNEHERWRFYIFEGKDETLFANYYDPKISGYMTPMYQIHHSNESLHKHFSNYFEEIWNSEEESCDACSYIINDFAQTNNVLTQCVGCKVQATCKRIRDENLDIINHARNVCR